MRKIGIITLSFLFLAFSAASLAQSEKTISLGQRSDEVKTIQEVLKTDKTIYPEGLVTGYFGPATKRAVAKVQARCGLLPTGTIDEPTEKCIFPVDYQVTVVSPNGGETWDRGQIQIIKWATLSRQPSPTNTEPGGRGTSVAPPRPLWSKASIDLFRKPTIPCQVQPGGPEFCPAIAPLATFVKHLAVVNLFDGSYSWKISNDIPNGSDYVVRITVGRGIWPLYLQEKEGSAVKPESIWPSPLVEWDESDNPFTISGQVVPPRTDLGEVIKILQEIADQLAKAIQLLRQIR